MKMARQIEHFCRFSAESAVFFSLLVVILVFAALPFVRSTTHPADVSGLQVLYTSLNNPSQLTNWKSNGGDPCAESWKGVTCEGSSVVSIEISSLRLSGSLGYLLSNLVSLKNFDLSNNNIHEAIPYQLPPNLTSLNLAANNLTGNLPYSLSSMVSLNYLNMSRNSLSTPIGDVFANLTKLKTLDLSFNNLSGDLPNSFTSLTSLSSLYLQNNQLTGSLSVLTSSPLNTLNVAHNHFSGWIPQELVKIHTLIYDGNSLANGPAPPPPPPPPSPSPSPSYTTPPPRKSHGNHTRGGATSPKTSGSSNSTSDKELGTETTVAIILGVVLLILVPALAFFFCSRKNRKEVAQACTTGSQQAIKMTGNAEMQEQRAKPANASVIDLRPPPVEKIAEERLQGSNGSMKQAKSPITATSYTVAALQTVTDSFSQDSLMGEGSIGSVYKGEFPNGKTMAVKKIDNSVLSLQEEVSFLEAVSNMSGLRHPNIVRLVGYCAQHGQRLLVYEHVRKGNLHDMLHFSENSCKMLTWNARVRIALGTARALEYLHEVCLPPVVHRNLKSANILVDEELSPHLSDCGLAALTANTERKLTTEMVGSFGYSAPEFALTGIYTVKSDVYSFGVVMLELLTGRKPLDRSRARAEQWLVRWATPQLHDIDALAKMVDPSLNGMYPAKSLSRFADIIALCVQPEPEFRPPMSEVVQQLVRLIQRASILKRRSRDEPGFPAYKTPEHESIDMPF
ncbi:hypothetical protein SAY87_022851 [Trapa incisa]|uniref:Protein kinase domain-containing protein n=1 Tax=Trapa incisa TaxID=236973 RepID=A0AAN7K399_9MYRT|nr:hypothetical protein SAY87_022851 [Trapa incisa]